MSEIRIHFDNSATDILKREDSFARQVRTKVEAVLKGRTRLDELVGATSVRGAVGLVLGKLEGATTLNEEDVWDYLDRDNRKLVIAMQDHYRDRARRWRAAQSDARA